jgi:TPR repeat protein
MRPGFSERSGSAHARIAFICLFCFCWPALADAGYDEGLAAFKSEDFATALSQLAPLAAEGDARAQAILGDLYSGGHGVARNRSTALKWYRAAAAKGQAHAAFALGEIAWRTPDATKTSRHTALEWYRKAAENGDAEAERTLADMYLAGPDYSEGQGVLAVDEAQYSKWLGMAADHGDLDAEKTLASDYLRGHGVARDVGKALAWYDKVASQGDADAAIAMGDIYARGLDVPFDAEKARDCYKRAAAARDNGAARRVGDMYVALQDEKQALEWYLKAARGGAGDAADKVLLGDIYAAGRGTPKSDEQAAFWYREAATRNLSAEGQFKLGLLYAEGRGVAKDAVVAYVLFTIAESGGSGAIANLSSLSRYAPAVPARYALMNILTPAQRAEGNALAAQWTASQPLPTNSRTGGAGRQ